MASRRAVAPIIATLLLVAIAVVGGSIIFVFSQGFFSAAQVSGSPNIESLKFTGYDASGATLLTLHDGSNTYNSGNDPTDGSLTAGEQVSVFIQNNGVSKATLGEIRVGGTVYQYEQSTGAAFVGTGNVYHIMISPTAATNTSTPELQPGQQATVVLELGEDWKNGRDAQFKLTTSNGAVFVGTVVAGQQTG